MSFTYSFKFIIIGDISNKQNNINKKIGVGKSSLLNQFIDKKFTNKYQMTVGVEFVSRTIFIENQLIKLQIWDTV